MSNGLGWMPDGKHMLDFDTHAGTVTFYDVVEATDGPSLANPRVLIEIDPSDDKPDGLAIDESGAFWLAIWGSGQILRYNPRGDADAVTESPTRRVTSCCFGSTDLDTMFITTARQVDETADSLSGGLSTVDAGVRGAPTRSFTGPLPRPGDANPTRC